MPHYPDFETLVKATLTVAEIENLPNTLRCKKNSVAHRLRLPRIISLRDLPVWAVLLKMKAIDLVNDYDVASDHITVDELTAYIEQVQEAA